MYGFLLVRNCNYSSILCQFWVIWRWIIYRDLEIGVRGQSRSLKLVPFESLGAVFYSPSIDSISYHFRVRARYWSSIVIFSYPTAFDAPVRGSFVKLLPYTVWYWKTRMVRIARPIGYQRLKSLKMSSRFGRIPACDRRTDGQIDRHLATA